MALRTPDEYRESLRDGRRVYIMGEKVEDVTAHPLLKVATETVAQDFVLTESEVAETSARYLFVKDLFRWWRVRRPESLQPGAVQ